MLRLTYEAQDGAGGIVDCAEEFESFVLAEKRAADLFLSWAATHVCVTDVDKGTKYFPTVCLRQRLGEKIASR